MNFSLSSAAKLVAVLSLAAFAGCGGGSQQVFDLGREAYEAGDYAQAARRFGEALERAPEDVDAAFHLALAELKLGELKAAQSAVEQALALAGGDADVRDLAAQIAYHQKDYARARELYQALAEDTALEPSLRSRALASLGVVEQTTDQCDLARIDFLKAIRLDRRNASAWYHLGLLYRDAFGYQESALEQFSIYVRLDPVASPRVQRVQRTFIPGIKEAISRSLTSVTGAEHRDSAACSKALQAAETAVKKNQFKTARLRYADAVKADPLSYPAALGLARAWLKTDKSAYGKKQAFDAYLAACRLSPSATSTFLATGDLAMEQGMYVSAVEVYSRAMAADPTNISVIDGLIRALRKAGHAKKAALYQEYRETIPVRGKKGK